MGYILSTVVIFLMAWNISEAKDLKVVTRLRKANEKEFPYLISVQEYKPNTLSYEHMCGGFLVTMQHVITAANCMYNKTIFYRTKKTSIVPRSTKRLFVSAGSIYANPTLSPEACRDNKDSERIKVKELTFPPDIKPHPEDPYIIIDDIALIKSVKEFKKSSAIQQIRFIWGTTGEETEPLYTKYQAKDNKDNCFLAGWGYESTTYNRPERKLEGIVPATVLNVMNPQLLDFDECKKFWCEFNKKYCGKMDFRVDNLLCAKGSKDSTPCDGDFGSPIVCEGNLVGMLSFLKDRKDCGILRPDGYVSGIKIFQFLRAKRLSGGLLYSGATSLFPIRAIIVLIIILYTQ